MKKPFLKKKTAIFLCSILFSFSLSYGQDDSIDFSDEALFTDDDLFFTETIEPASELKIDAKASSLIFEEGTVRFGGSLQTSINIESSWIKPFTKDCDFIDGGLITLPAPLGSKRVGGLKNTKLNSTIDLDFFFDVRPKENQRLYGKFNINYPFYTQLDGEDSLDQGLTVPSFSVFELFTDFDLNDKFFFRFGKHTVKWGVGYFFSPADIINLGSIDPQKPEQQLEGPLSLRLLYPIPETQNTLWFYALPDENTFLARDAALAFKSEFLAGTSELGLGAWFKYKRPPHLMATVSGSIAQKVGVFSEAVFAWGNETDWTEEISIDSMKPVFDFTLGASYYWDALKMNFAGQYLFGFDCARLDQTEEEESYYGSHRAALSISRLEFISKNISLSLLALLYEAKNLSGTGNLSLSYAPNELLSLTTGPSIVFNKDELLSLNFSLALRLGGGKF